MIIHFSDCEAYIKRWMKRSDIASPSDGQRLEAYADWLEWAETHNPEYREMIESECRAKRSTQWGREDMVGKKLEGKMSRQVTLFQGSGSVTELKSDELFKLIRMRMQQNQGSWVKRGKVKRFFIFNLFCGERVNIVDDKTVLGSPLCALNALRSCKLVDVVEEVGLYLSDVRPEAIDMLNAEIESNYIPDNAKVHLQNIEAKGALSQITNFLSRQEDYHAILILDPNGPAQIPLEELDAFSQLHSDNSDVILNFNVTAFKRVFGHRNGKGKDSYNGWWAGWVKDVDDFVSIVSKHYKGTWMRENRPGLSGWSILCCFGYSAPSNWKKQGYFPYEQVRKSWITK